MPRAVGGRKTCTKCKTEKAVEAFSTTRRTSDLLQTWCSVCMSKYASDDPSRGMYLAAKRRAAERGTPFTMTREDAREILAGATCAYCGTHVESWSGRSAERNGAETASLDCIIPALGYTRENVTLSCKSCNRQKADHTVATLEYWLGKVKAIIAERGLGAATN